MSPLAICGCTCLLTAAGLMILAHVQLAITERTSRTSETVSSAAPATTLPAACCSRCRAALSSAHLSRCDDAAACEMRLVERVIVGAPPEGLSYEMLDGGLFSVWAQTAEFGEVPILFHTVGGVK